MDIRQLTYFAAVAQHRSFTKAARQLHITQPTLSKTVKILEQELGVTLFDRSAKQIELTDAGQAIFRSAKQIIVSLDTMTEELADIVQLKKGTLSLGIPPMVGGHLFPSIIGQFHKQYPHIRLQLVEHGGKRIEAEVENGELDIGLVILPDEDAGKFHRLPVLEENLTLVLYPEHRLAPRKSVRLAELEHESFIMFREDFILPYLIKEACNRAGFEPEVVFESAQWDFMTELVSTKFGIALLPEGIGRTLDPQRFRTVPLIQPTIPWRLSMIWKKDKYQSYATRQWIQFMQALQSPISDAK